MQLIPNDLLRLAGRFVSIVEIPKRAIAPVTALPFALTLTMPLACALVLVPVLGLGLAVSPAFSQDTIGVEGYYRFPAVSGDTVIFTAEGDLWSVPLAGGLARRLTTHQGDETAAAISPDGLTIAFSATYDGPTEVYLMPISGGVPKRLSWEADSSVVEGFTNDGEVLYSTRAYSTLPDPNLVRVNTETLERVVVPLNQAGAGSYSATGELYFSRPGFHRNNTKRYQGGTARNIWKVGPGLEAPNNSGSSERTEAVNLTADFPGENHSPMAARGRVYYVTDPDGTMNVWSLDASGADPRQHTYHSGWDVKSPSTDGSTVVYQLGADLWKLDLATDSSEKIGITLASDFDQLRERWITNPTDYLTAVDLDYEGKKVALTTRGRVFVFPTGKGRPRQIARKPGVRYRDAAFLPKKGAGNEELSPSEEDLLVLSDETGEVEFYRAEADGSSDVTQLSRNGDILRFEGVPSPDGRHIAFTDKNFDLRVLEIATGPRATAQREPGRLLRPGVVAGWSLACLCRGGHQHLFAD